MGFRFRFVSKATSALSDSVQNYSDVYYLAYPTDSLQSKTLVYAVYATELVQSILLAKKFYQEFAAGFGNYEAVDAIGLLWFAVPIMNSIGVYYPLFWPLSFVFSQVN